MPKCIATLGHTGASMQALPARVLPMATWVRIDGKAYKGAGVGTLGLEYDLDWVSQASTSLALACYSLMDNMMTTHTVPIKTITAS